MVFCDDDGRVYDHPRLLAAGADGPGAVPLRDEHMIPVPRGSDIMMLAGRSPVGFDPRTGERVVFSQWEGKPVHTAAVFMAPAHTQSHSAAYVSRDHAPTLPLYAYTAMAYGGGRFHAAGTRVDLDPRQDPWRFPRKQIGGNIERVLSELGDNRVALQLKKCALDYKCRAAQNFFLGRWEAPLPVSVACNSSCVGCLSLQQDGEFKAAHDRLRTPPRPEEIANVALRHIEAVDQAVVSFGQGCEGEPLIAGETLRRSIEIIRGRTSRGTINLNSNGSLPDTVAKLIDAGLDGIRVSLNSVREPLYNAYYRPKAYTFRDVTKTIDIATDRGIINSVNLLYFPGVTDTPDELNAMAAFFEEYPIDLIQLRNLNIDPELYLRYLPKDAHQDGIGTREFITTLTKKFPHIRFGYFNPPKESFGPRKCA
jgi:molybdenum cofactor biosynthesis enzyme MoaA